MPLVKKQTKKKTRKKKPEQKKQDPAEMTSLTLETSLESGWTCPPAWELWGVGEREGQRSKATGGLKVARASEIRHGGGPNPLPLGKDGDAEKVYQSVHLHTKGQKDSRPDCDWTTVVRQRVGG